MRTATGLTMFAVGGLLVFAGFKGESVWSIVRSALDDGYSPLGSGGLGVPPSLPSGTITASQRRS